MICLETGAVPGMNCAAGLPGCILIKNAVRNGYVVILGDIEGTAEFFSVIDRKLTAGQVLEL